MIDEEEVPQRLNVRIGGRANLSLPQLLSLRVGRLMRAWSVPDQKLNWERQADLGFK